MKVFFNHFKQTTSSNDIASEWLKQAEPGSVNVVTTDDQTGGRGQRGRAWDQRAWAGPRMVNGHQVASRTA